MLPRDTGADAHWVRLRPHSGGLLAWAPDVPLGERTHPRTLGWPGTTALAMGGSNQSLFLIGVLFVSQGTAAVPLLIVGLVLSWMAIPGWIELILMWPNRVGGIAATCAEAFRPYSPVLANLTGVCYWWGWVPTCGLTAYLSASALHQWYLPGVPVAPLACGIIVTFAALNLCGVKWVARLAIPLALSSASLAALSAFVSVGAGEVNWHRATTFQLIVPFAGVFGKITSAMAGLYLIGFAAPAFEAAACHVGETRDPARNVPRAMWASAATATLYFVVLPVVWLGVLGRGPIALDSLATVLGPTFAPLLGGAATTAAIWFLVFNMFHGTLQPLAGAARTLSQLAEDGLLPRTLGIRLRKTDAPLVAIVLTACLAILFVAIGTPLWALAAANLTYLIGICLPSVAVWLLRRNEPARERPYRAPRGTIMLGVSAAAAWGCSALLGFQQFGLPTVLAGLALAYSGSVLYAARIWADRRREGKRGFARSLHMTLTGAMLAVLVLAAVGYLVAVAKVPAGDAAITATLVDIFVGVGLLTITVGLVLPGVIGHAVGEVSKAAERLSTGALADLNRGIHALGAGNLAHARARIVIEPVVVRTNDEIGVMADRFNQMQHEIARASVSLDDAREELLSANEGFARMSRQNELLLTAAGEGILGLDREGRVTFVNPAVSAMVGYTADELVGRNLHALLHHTRPDGTPLAANDCPIVGMLRGEQLPPIDGDVFWHENGTPIPIRCTATPIVESNEIVGAVLVVSDISRQIQLEDEIRQTQKMDAIGQLAGGVAHDFNNLLTVISGYSEFALARQSTTDPQLRNDLQEIGTAADRAAALTQQLLAFSRKEMLQPEVLDVNAIVSGTVSLLHRLIEEVVSIETKLDPELPAIKADSGQIEQILINLSLNARDAMPAGGTLTIETERVLEPTGEAVVRLSVSDTGSGIDEATRSRIFEPFFTTKEPGKGTGLGLSTVYGIVQQVSGTIDVESAPGAGTRFTITMPATDQAITSTPTPTTLGTSTGGAETILLVEDEDIVRTLVCRVLVDLGYSVVDTADPLEALELCTGDEAFDLLITDVVMPGMNGRELAAQLVDRLPGLKVLFTSGYASDTGVTDEPLGPGTGFLQKPFELGEFAAKVRELLDPSAIDEPLQLIA
jgi:PAS domain S-box-containing protein